MFCTPEYAGALPGSFKNLLDWTVGGPEMDGQPVAWLNVSSVAAPTGGADAHASLAKVMGYINARVIEPACRRIPMTRQAIGDDGTVTEPGIREEISDALQTLQREVALTSTN
ncbi:NADPH-dependent FMN reductase [Kribbella sp. DT2]|uniref:NADPH-dependent FMN reductase n=1 Tax=Kribbella sp. DT2 TaxID=3393427 RepID=UPI003CF0E860